MKLTSHVVAALAASVSLPLQAAAPARKAAVTVEPSLIDIKPDLKTGKIIATFPKPGDDGVAARYIQTVIELDTARYALLARTGRLLPALGIDPVTLDPDARANRP